MSFAAQMEKYMKKYVSIASNVAIGAAKDTCERLILNTPVDTGNARANYQATLDAPASGTIKWGGDDNSTARASERNNAINGIYGAPGRVFAPDPTPGSSYAIAQMEAVADKAVGRNLYLTNNLPYIERLEYGYSNQAQGMFRDARVNWLKTVGNNVQKYKK